jgi:hypothetical protein
VNVVYTVKQTKMKIIIYTAKFKALPISDKSQKTFLQGKQFGFGSDDNVCW